MENLLSTDTFFNGKVSIEQTLAGFRFSIDAVLLAAHCRIRPNGTVVDLGTGCGIVSILLSFRYPAATIYGIEIQRELARLACRNVKKNGMQHTVHVLRSDIRTFAPETIPEPIDLVVSNPPYRKVGAGRINPNRQRAAARHELTVTLADVVGSARRLLGKGGRLVMIYTAERAADLIEEMRRNAIEPKTIRCIHSKGGEAARLLIAEGVREGQPGMTIAPPLTLYGEDGRYCREVQQMFEP
ncbi:MAG: tRNA1(Val) (adenine(37)-N6)-methyltransferase [Desulfobacteraceae bacterium]|nr:MAG: tRNA1(Val) (adenine(37)-N6)-methyltransferase [Desulfobacteraceae bacterium]